MLKKYRAPSIVVLCLTIVLVVFQNCGSGGGGGGPAGSLVSSSLIDPLDLSSIEGEYFLPFDQNSLVYLKIDGDHFSMELLKNNGGGQALYQENDGNITIVGKNKFQIEYIKESCNPVGEEIVKAKMGTIAGTLEVVTANDKQYVFYDILKYTLPVWVTSVSERDEDSSCSFEFFKSNESFPDGTGTTVTTGNGLGEPSTGTNPWNTGTTGSAGGGTTGGTSGGDKPPGFENCDISAKYYASGINYMGICQSTLDETSVAVNSTVSDTARTCLVPTYKNATGSTTYLGQPQCYAPQAGQVTMGKIYKTRQGFTGNPINGVMVLKEASLTAYYTCMDALITFSHPQCPNGANTNQYCNQMARDRMATLCNTFKTTHSYIDIRLKD